MCLWAAVGVIGTPEVGMQHAGVAACPLFFTQG
jgi:hypothetical protein